MNNTLFNQWLKIGELLQSKKTYIAQEEIYSLLQKVTLINKKRDAENLK